MSLRFNIKNYFPLLAILLVAVFLRFGFFNQSPPSVNWDEASLGYNAYSIFKTGRDEWGRLLPLTFEAFGDYKLPVYIYTAVPFVAVFGLNEFGIRLPSMIAGVILVLLIYLIIIRISGNKNWALVSSLLMAVSPTGVFLSRIALEANLALCLFISGVYLLLLGKNNQKYLFMSAILFGLTLFTYNSARVFVPLFLLTVFVFKFRKIKIYSKKLLLPAAVFALLSFLAGYLALTQDSSSRYYWVTILDEGAINSINQSRGSSEYGPILTKLIFNRYTYFIYHAAVNYISHFSPGFLLFEGGSNYQFSVPKTGFIYLVELVFLIFGIVKIFKQKTWSLLFLAWIILAPVPAAITRESPHVLRSIFLLGGLQIIAGYGFISAYLDLTGKLKKTRVIFITVVGILLIVQSVIYFRNYFFTYPAVYSQSWQYGYKQAVEYILSKENLSERPLYITKRYGEPHIFYLFYTQYDPAKYQSNPDLTRYERSNWRWVDRIDNIYFVNDWEMKQKLNDEHGYVISTEKNYPGIPTVLKTINFLDGTVAFEIVEI